MRCSVLVCWALGLSVALCLEGLEEDPILEISRNVTAVLGEDAVLLCVYRGSNEILGAEWSRQINSKVKSKGLAGFKNQAPYGRNGFSEPGSMTNLTVRVKVQSLDAEGEYTCEFESEDEYYSDNIFLSVVARPDIQIQLTTETINGSHYQSVSCSAVSGRPPPQISWLVGGLPAPDYPFTVDVNATAHSNGTSTLTSTLRFPTHLQNEDSVTCAVRHPTFADPKLTTMRVETYATPNVSIKAEMVQRGGSEFWVVSCISSGGRPDTNISLVLNADGEPQRDDKTDSGAQTSSYFLPAAAYEGQNITCVFRHPKFTRPVSKGTTLPSFYVSGVQWFSSGLGNSSSESWDSGSIELREGQNDFAIGLRVSGNVPRYNLSCSRDDGLLPAGVEVVGGSLAFRGQVGLQHAGLYNCLVSYHHVQAGLRINITVKPRAVQLVPPAVDLQTEDGVIECSAADGVPAANMSWLLPEGVSAVSWFNFTSHNGSHTVKGVLLLPACSPWEHAATCVINHPAFEEPESRSATLPVCSLPNITLDSLTGWDNGEEYTEVACSVDSIAPAAVVFWRVGNSGRSISSQTEMELRADGWVRARSSVRFPSLLYSGQNLSCSVEHRSLRAPEKRTILVEHRALLMSVSVGRLPNSPLWMAVCDYRGPSISLNLAWLLPGKTESQTSMELEQEGQFLKARLTYQFSLALQEGQNLTCVYRHDHGSTEKTVHVPKYYITAVRVQNHTTPLQSRYSGETITHRLTLQENQHHQRILLRVEGSVPDYNLICKRSDGLFVQMDGDAMVFQQEVTEEDAGLYTCQASFYHHAAMVSFQVDVMSEDRLLALWTLVCICSTSVIVIVAIVTCWACCTANKRPQNKGQEAVSPLTALMQEPGSPEVKKPAFGDDSKEYAQLISYSIVFEHKSTV
eukprot:XP_011606873.1 PREDICTED: uncharacterized protein LOC105417078 [Takifugu rubripes]